MIHSMRCCCKMSEGFLAKDSFGVAIDVEKSPTRGIEASGSPEKGKCQRMQSVRVPCLCRDLVAGGNSGGVQSVILQVAVRDSPHRLPMTCQSC